MGSEEAEPKPPPPASSEPRHYFSERTERRLRVLCTPCSVLLEALRRVFICICYCPLFCLKEICGVCTCCCIICLVGVIALLASVIWLEVRPVHIVGQTDMLLESAQIMLRGALNRSFES